MPLKNAPARKAAISTVSTYGSIAVYTLLMVSCKAPLYVDWENARPDTSTRENCILPVPSLKVTAWRASWLRFGLKSVLSKRIFFDADDYVRRARMGVKGIAEGVTVGGVCVMMD